jgi:hypothetical protein
VGVWAARLCRYRATKPAAHHHIGKSNVTQFRRGGKAGRKQPSRAFRSATFAVFNRSQRTAWKTGSISRAVLQPALRLVLVLFVVLVLSKPKGSSREKDYENDILRTAADSHLHPRTQMH